MKVSGAGAAAQVDGPSPVRRRGLFEKLQGVFNSGDRVKSTKSAAPSTSIQKLLHLDEIPKAQGNQFKLTQITLLNREECAELAKKIRQPPRYGTETISSLVKQRLKEICQPWFGRWPELKRNEQNYSTELVSAQLRQLGATDPEGLKDLLAFVAYYLAVTTQSSQSNSLQPNAIDAGKESKAPQIEYYNRDAILISLAGSFVKEENPLITRYGCMTRGLLNSLKTSVSGDLTSMPVADIYKKLVNACVEKALPPSPPPQSAKPKNSANIHRGAAAVTDATDSALYDQQVAAPPQPPKPAKSGQASVAPSPQELKRARAGLKPVATPGKTLPPVSSKPIAAASTGNGWTISKP